MYTVFVVGFVIGNLLTAGGEHGSLSDDSATSIGPGLLL